MRLQLEVVQVQAGFAGDRYAYIKPGRTIALKLSYQDNLIKSLFKKAAKTASFYYFIYLI